MGQPQLVIRADASEAIGAGHIMRCIAIAQAWQVAGGQSTFVTGAIPESLRARIIREGYETHTIPEEMRLCHDAIQVLKLADDLGATSIVIDGYSFDADYHQLVAASKFTSLAIDDNAGLTHYSTDFVLNQNLGVTQKSYRSRSSDTQLLLGTSYALIRQEFLAAGKRLDRSSCERILVTLGGSDPKNFTSIAVAGLEQLSDERFEFRVILGSLNEHVASIVAQVSRDRRFQVLHDVQDMSEHYLWADAVIAAGGSSNWEMCYFCLPRVVVALADNQVEIVGQLERCQIAISMGNPDTIEPQDVIEALKRLMNTPGWIPNARKQSKDLVDGYGSSRCVAHLLSHPKSLADLP